jgi:hypothetical protein
MPLPARWRSHKLAGVVFALGALLVLVDLGRWLIRRGTEAPPLFQPRADWAAYYRGGIHFSGFVFRDRNRSGALDLGDGPLAGIVIEMSGPGGARAIERSNLSGFANFQMSRFQRDAVIREPGLYGFRAIIPAGWTVTTGNAEQSSRFAVLPGAPADMVSENPTTPVGLAPELFVAGRVVARSQNGELAPALGASLAAIDPSGQAVAVELGADGSFRFPAVPGLWRLRAGAPARAVPLEREVLVRDAPVRMAALDLSARAAALSFSPRMTVDFDSITTTSLAKIPSGMAGLNWNYLNAIATAQTNEGYVNNVGSGGYAGYSSSGHPVTISRAGGFDFYGGYFGAGLPAAEGETLRIAAFRGGVEVAREELPLSALGPVWFDADYRSIERLVLTTLHYWQFVTDDLLIATPAP